MSNEVETYNLGRLGVIGMRGCEEITNKVNEHLKNFNKDNISEDFETFVIPINCPRFGTGEAKAMILHSIRTYDVYIIMDAFNYGVTYNMYGQERPMSPDDLCCMRADSTKELQENPLIVLLCCRSLKIWV